MLALLLGTLLAVGALAFVLYPLFAGVIVARPPARHSPRDAASAEKHDSVVALREIEFDRVTGKLSDSDYAELKSRYTARALAAMRRGDRTTEAARLEGEDPAEAAVLAYRARLHACAHCGPRPEPDAVYCSTCGTYLPGKCARCEAAITQPGSAFCDCCGMRLAA